MGKRKNYAMKEITFEEKRRVQLEMLKEIHVFCKNNDIKYSLAYGTLLGAIRHKGFIPWDDDIDIMMPYPDLELFKKKFESESLMYADIDTLSHYEFGFPRIVHKQSFCKAGILSKTYGINIDLYPITSIPDNPEEQNRYFARGESILKKRLSYMRKRSLLRYFIPLSTLPIFDKLFDRVIREYRDFIFSEGPQYGTTIHYHIWAGPLSTRSKRIYDKDLFEEIREVTFEGLHLMSIAEYDYFLSHTYGNYMQLPPIEQRVPYHGGRYYWK